MGGGGRGLLPVNQAGSPPLACGGCWVGELLRVDPVAAPREASSCTETHPPKMV